MQICDLYLKIYKINLQICKYYCGPPLKILVSKKRVFRGVNHRNSNAAACHVLQFST